MRPTAASSPGMVCMVSICQFFFGTFFTVQKPQVPSLVHQCNNRDCCCVCNFNRDTLANGATDWKPFSCFCYRQREIKWVTHKEGPSFFVELAMKCKIFTTAGTLSTSHSRIWDCRHICASPKVSSHTGPCQTTGRREGERRDSWRSTVAEHCSKNDQHRKKSWLPLLITIITSQQLRSTASIM